MIIVWHREPKSNHVDRVRYAWTWYLWDDDKMDFLTASGASLPFKVRNKVWKLAAAAAKLTKVFA